VPDFTQLTPDDRAEMLSAVGIERIEQLFEDVPADVRFPTLDLPPALSELEAVRHLSQLAAQNVSVRDWPCFIGGGAYNHYSPSAVSHIMGQPNFYTAYTPYQPEVSQGTLQASFEFQSLVCELLDMDVANDSVYDGASAVGEAVLMAQRLTRRERVVLSGSLHPQWRDVVRSYVAPRGVELIASQLDPATLHESRVLDLVDGDTACVVVQQPDVFGHVRDLNGLSEEVHARGALLIVAVADATSLGTLKSPGGWGADIATAEGQSLGLPLQYGGPWAGLMACKTEFMRQLPGRISGQTTDHDGRRGFVLTLQAREQHIRREKATSNICTSQTLLAIGITAYMALMGPSGLREVARQSHAKAVYAADRIADLPGYGPLTKTPSSTRH
jgi:glycine cleavage system P protein (glycine dehydrogenase) subunit 1